ncbi:NAD-dependent epimerase/dehydratase family protein, partial [Veillonella parvula]
MLEGGLKQIITMGSMHEVGYWEGAIDENTPTHPSSYYGIAKNALRDISKLLADANGACWQWVRAYYIYGDDLRGSSIFSKIAK